MKRRIVPILTLAVFASVLARGADLSTQQTAQTSAPPASQQSGVILSASAKEDIGDMRPASEAGVLSYFHTTAQLRGNYSSNPQLYHNNSAGDFLTMPSLETRFSAPMGGGFRLNGLARAESIIYSRYDERGVWGFSGQADIEYRYRPQWPRIFAGVEPYYYNAFENSRHLAAAVGPVTGIDKGWAINRGRTLLIAAYKFGSYFADPTLDDRNTHSLTLSCTHQIRPGLFAQVFYQWQFSDYRQEDRHDSRNIAGANMVYQFTPHLFGTLSASYVNNDSDRSLADYQNVNAGAGLTWQF